jgi:hypothetical protein
MKKLFGDPSYLDSRPGGVAMWSFRESNGESNGSHTMPFTRIVVRDKIPQRGAGIGDHIYVTIPYSLDSADKQRVLRATDSIEYDESRNEMTAGSNTLESAMALLVFVDKVSRNIISYSDILEGKKFGDCMAASHPRGKDNYIRLQIMKEGYELNHPALPS